MERRQYLLTAATAILFSSVIIGCADNRARSLPAWSPPELKERTVGLDPGDYGPVKERVDRFRATLLRNPADVDALIGLAQVLMYEGRVTGDHPYYYPAADDLLDRALGIDPQNVQGVLSKASILLSLHKFNEALSMAEQAIRLAPNLAAGYGALVDANVELGNYEAAIEAADRMTAIRPDLKSYSRISYLREIHGDVEGAIEAMRLAVDAGAPGSEEKAWGRTTLGQLYLGEGRLEEAEDEFTLAMLEREDYPFALAGLADIHIAKGNADSAVQLLDRAIALLPEFSFVEMQADIYRRNGDDRRADSLIGVIEAMLAEDEASGHDMDRELALLWTKHGIKPEEALERAKREYAKRPANIDAQELMARVLLGAGKPEEARAYSLKARRLGTQHAMMIRHAGLIEMALGNEKEGETLLQRARSINPYLPAGGSEGWAGL